MEQVKIIVDEKGSTCVYANGEKIKHVTKIKFEVDTEKDSYPSLEIKKDFLPIQKVDFTEPKIKMDGKDIFDKDYQRNFLGI